MSSAKQVTNRYELVKRIAVGGMAEVFLAKTYGSHGFEKTLAIKRILPDLASDPEFVQRFIAEAKISVTLNHANVVQVLDFSRFGESLYIAMEYVDGLDLAALLKGLGPRGRLPVPACLYLAIEILKGLDFAHRRGVVHRDVSPSNVLVSRAGEVKIADFGIAQAAGTGKTQTRRIMGKWRYMSPEQTVGDPLDTRSDLFSVGSVLYELFTGEKLFKGKDIEEIVDDIHHQELPSVTVLRPELPAAIDDVLAGLMARDREHRCESAGAALQAFVEISYEQSLHATPMSLADVVSELMPSVDELESDENSNSGELIDHILRSELDRESGGDKTRLTVDDGRMPSFDTKEHSAIAPEVTMLTFVERGADRDGITRWGVDSTVQTAAITMALPSLDDSEGEDELAAPPTADLRGPEEQGPPVTMEVSLLDVKGPPVTMEVLASGKQAPPVTVDVPAPHGAARHQSESRPGRGKGLGVAVVLAAALGGVVLWMWPSTNEQGSTAVATETDAPEVSAAAPSSVPAPAAAASPSLASAQVSSDPRGAQIRVDGKGWPELAPTLIELSTAGKHTIELSLQGFSPCTIDVPTLEVGTTTPVTCELVATSTALAIETSPSGASVVVDGEVLGKTPLRIADFLGGAGSHQLVLKKNGYQTHRETFEFSAGKDLELERKLVARKSEPRFGTIDLYVEPWANVYLKGKKIGVAPQRGLRLPAGRHTLRLDNPVQKRSQSLRVVVPGKKPYRVTLPPP